MSQPEIFIIESLEFKDERSHRFEGRIISQILALNGKKCEYCCIRTTRELKEMPNQFASSRYRYLHLSCHGNSTTMFTTLDGIPFADFGQLIKPYVRNRRLFLSACSATNRTLADSVMPESGCYSILGPDQDTYFNDYSAQNVYGFGAAESTLNNSLGGLNALYQTGGPRSLQLALKMIF
jgi:hypothetical protein